MKAKMGTKMAAQGGEGGQDEEDEAGLEEDDG